ELVVIGDLGEPFLRVGPHGVSANVNSPTWYASGNPDGIAMNMPKSAKRGARPHWIKQSQRPTWAWFDRRVQPPGSVPPQARDGRPFARIGPAGVDVNTRSSTYVAQGVSSGSAPRPEPGAGAPRWRHVASVPRYGWVDPRLRYPSIDPPADVARQDHPVVLKH